MATNETTSLERKALLRRMFDAAVAAAQPALCLPPPRRRQPFATSCPAISSSALTSAE